ncbi:SCO family protein [Thalassospira xiamenensis]|nr:SCO family protein [Thalassospira xiamenensis]
MQKLFIGLVAIAAAAIGFVSYQNIGQQEPKKALIYEPARAPAPFQLSSTDSETPINNSALKGQWTLLFTGYTFCPDICPTTMAQLRDVLPELQEKTDTPVKVWMISVDPQRDTMQRLKDYTGFFGEDFVGIRAEHKDLFPFVRDLGLMYSIPDEGEEDYLVNHSAAIIVVNPDGNRQAIFNAEHVLGEIPTVNMEHLSYDFGILVNQ